MTGSATKDSAVPLSITEEKRSAKKESPPIEPEVLDKLPPELRKAFEISLQTVSSPVFNPILNRITEGHIDKVLAQADKDSDRSFRDSQSTKRYNLLFVLIFAALFVFTVAFLVDKNPELLKDMEVPSGFCRRLRI